MMTDVMGVDVEDLRQRGNHEFQVGNVENALGFYSTAIEHSKPGSPSFILNLCNRSACFYQLEDYEHALKDALQAWKASQQSNIKAGYRASKTYLMLRQPSDALQVLQTALTIPDLTPSELKSLQDLEQQAKDQLDEPEKQSEYTIKGIARPISIREFVKGKQLGVGNFSEIIVVTHKVTQEVFALKILEKKQAAELAKRQHVSQGTTGID
jgi:tetratricopeptide (TPR) repeat protein